MTCDSHNYTYIRAPVPSTAEKKKTWIQYKKRRIQATGTTFSNFGEEVGMKGGHGNSVTSPRKQELTNEPIFTLPKYGLKEAFEARAE